MKGSNSPLLRVLYIILVPIVLLIILLNSGWLQRVFPAATLNGERYSAVRYNYYYFDYYNTFLEEHEAELEELGYDPKTDSDKQYYSASMTWEEFFKQQAELNLAETAYYCDLAEKAGYTFSDEELAPVQERLGANEAQRTLIGLSSNNYYISYYGSGMTEKIYAEELTRSVKAQAYKQYLIEQYTPAQNELTAEMAVRAELDYTALRLRVITLDALPDRATGEIGPSQLEALQSQLDVLVKRYENGVPFEELQASFSTCAIGDDRGGVTATRAAGLPQVLVAHYIEAQEIPGSDWSAPFACVDEEAGRAYFVLSDGSAGSGPELDAEAALSAQAIEEQETAALKDWTVTRNAIGQLVCAN